MRIRSRAALLAVAFTISACAAEEPGEPADTPEPATDAAPATDAVIEFTAEDYAFTGPPSLPAGWTHMRFHNAGAEPHFLLLWKLPEGVEFADYAENVTALFGRELTRYHAGEIDRDALMAAVGGGLPPWFADVVGSGGSGLTSPGETAETWFHLDPGEYVAECYVATADGIGHPAEGMLRPLIVTEEMSGTAAPAADVTVTLSNYALELDGELSAGEHIFAVTAAEAPEGLLGHDLHLARLDEGTELATVVAWTDFVDQLRSPAPATFLGGADEVAPGATGYFRVTLTPGRYALVSEEYGAAGIAREFEVR